MSDEVLYDDLSPWDTDADGGGESLHRAAATYFGSSAESWLGREPTPGVTSFTLGVEGDLNGDGIVSAIDIDALLDAVNSGRATPSFDMDGSGNISMDDVIHLVEETLATFMGDTNLDRQVDSRDLNQVGIHWQSEQSCLGWAAGDFNGDGKVNSVDLNQIGVHWQSTAAARPPRAALAQRPTIETMWTGQHDEFGPAHESNHVEPVLDPQPTAQNTDVALRRWFSSPPCSGPYFRVRPRRCIGTCR